MSDYTPGPWKVKRRFDVYQDTQKPGVGGTFVASTKGNWPLPESVNIACEADARLIAAAPDLLEACRMLVESNDNGKLDDHMLWDAIELAQEAIAKATGANQ